MRRNPRRLYQVHIFSTGDPASANLRTLHYETRREALEVGRMFDFVSVVDPDGETIYKHWQHRAASTP